MREKIVLIQLPSPWLINDRDLPLMGVLYLAASLRFEGIEVQVADLVGVPEDKWLIPDADVYGVSLVSAQAPIAKRVIQHIRARTRRKVEIIVGGPHVSALPAWSLKHLDADYAFVGESDEAIVEFMYNGPSEKVDGLHGYASKFPRVPAGKIVCPARDLVDMWSFHNVGINRYVTDGVRYEGYLQTGRGCPFDCAFCAQAAITGRAVRYLSDEHLHTELDVLLKDYECDLIYIEDDTFNINKKRVHHLCENVFPQHKFKWHCLCRADTMDQALADVLASAGCQNVTFGFETGSDKMLKRMDKCETMEEAWSAIRCVKNAGMGIRGQMIVGFPGEDVATIAETKRFIETAPVDKWGFHAFVPLPGTQVWRNPTKFGFPEIDVDSEDFAAGFHTIGKPGEWAKVWGDAARVRAWLTELRELADMRNIYEYGVTEAEARKEIAQCKLTSS